MIELLSVGTGNVIGYRIKGKIETDDFDRIASFIEENLKTHDKLRIFAEIESIEGMSLEAFVKDLKFGLKNYNRFEKAAVITDKDWIRKIVEIEGKLFPGIDAKFFSFAEKHAAMEWISS